jgi:hypothetical protein
MTGSWAIWLFWIVLFLLIASALFAFALGISLGKAVALYIAIVMATGQIRMKFTG